MNYDRPIMWNVPEWAEITFYLLIPLVLVAFAAGVAWRVRQWFIGRTEPGAFREGASRAIRPAAAGGPAAPPVGMGADRLFQARLSSDGYSLVMHLAIFWGMLVLAIGTALATVDQDFTNLLFDAQILRGDFYKLMKLGLDLFGVVLILGLAMAAYRRYLVRPERLQATRTGVSLWDGFPFLTLLFLIAVMGFAIEGLRLAEGLKIDARVAAAKARRRRPASWTRSARGSSTWARSTRTPSWPASPRAVPCSPRRNGRRWATPGQGLPAAADRVDPPVH